MAKLSKKQAEAVKRLVVSYGAWQEYRNNVIADPSDKKSRNSMSIWAGILLQNQTDVGVEVVMPELLEANKELYLYIYLDSGGEVKYTDDWSKVIGV